MRRRSRHWWFFIAHSFAALLLLAGAQSRGGEAQPMAADPALEMRVNALSAELRCLVCQNQSLADSHADLAVNLKNQVREQLRAGRTEQQVIEYMTDRYGDFVRFRPPVKASTWLLWGGPLLLLCAGGLMLWRALGAARFVSPQVDAQAAEQTAQLARLLEPGVLHPGAKP